MNFPAKLAALRVLRLPLFTLLLALTSALGADVNQVITPRTTGAQPVETRGEQPMAYGAISVVGVLVLAGAGAWLLTRGRKMNLGNRDSRLLNIAETRSLGGKQYLVVATYENRKFLLGVCPGRIDLLAPLDDAAPTNKLS